MRAKPLLAICAGVATTAMVFGLSSCYTPTEYVAPPKADTGEKGWISSSEISAFIGTSNAKMAFTRVTKGVREVYYVDWNDTSLTETMLKKPTGKDGLHSDSPLMSPDGNYVTYYVIQRNPNGVYVQKLDASADAVLVDEAGTESHWWTAQNGDLYIVYSTQFIVDGIADGVGKTYRRKVTLGAGTPTVGAAEEIANVAMNGGLSRDGVYLCTGYYDAAFYNVSTRVITKVNTGLQVCNPAISPDAANPHEMLFLNFQGVQNLTGFLARQLKQHEAIIVVNPSNAATNYVLVGDSTDYIQWQDPDWSNHKNFVSALGAISDAKADAVVINLTTKGSLAVSKAGNELDITSTPSLWVGGVSDTPAGPLVLNYPAGGESFNVGDTVTVSWTVNSQSVSSVGVKLTLDKGKDGYTEIGINPSTGVLGSIDPTVATSFKWVPATDQISAECMIKVYDYTDESVNDVSGVFAVTN